MRAFLRHLWRALTDPPAPRYGRPRPPRPPLPPIRALLFLNRQVAEDHLRRRLGAVPKRPGGPLFVLPDGSEVLAVTPTLARRRGWLGYSIASYDWHESCEALAPGDRTLMATAAYDIGRIVSRFR